MLRNAEDKRKSFVDPDRTPWSKSPFVNLTEAATKDATEETVEDEKGKAPVTSLKSMNEFEVTTAHEVPRVDLILDIAMTTALANLGNNTSLLRGTDVLGYLCFWGLTWWIWASAVAYNVRFRQADWVHRGAVILQLVIFGALAAFTRDFDITAGLSIGDDPDQVRADRIQMDLMKASKEGISTRHQQQDRLPGLNFRGIAMTMAWSRVLLMTQYIIVYVYAHRQCHNPKRFSPTALLTHILSLLLSAIAFFVSFAVIGHNVSTGPENRGRNIAKIVLWYGAILVELSAHFLPPVLKMKGHVTYKIEELSSRATTLFLVVLGQGLDQLTGTFSFVVGPEGFGEFSIGLLISTAVIFIGQFSLFKFDADSLQKRFQKQCVRSLAWFFGQFIYTSTLIILISATKNELIVSNFLNVANYAVIATIDVQSQADKYFTENHSLLPANQVTENEIAILTKAGIATADIINVLFEADSIDVSDPESDGSFIEATLVQGGLNTFLTVAEQFGLKPEESDPLYWDFQLALSKKNDASVANLTTFTKLYASFLREHDDSVTWFPASAGGTLIITALLRYVGQVPQDRWGWVHTLTIGFSGVGYSLLSIMDIGSRRQIFVNKDDFDIVFNSAIFKFEDSGWVLPSFAILNLLILIAIGVQKYLRRRKIKLSQAQAGQEPPHSIPSRKASQDQSNSSIEIVPLSINSEAGQLA